MKLVSSLILVCDCHIFSTTRFHTKIFVILTFHIPFHQLMAHQCKIASCSQEKVRSALKRKILDNDLVSSSSGIVQSRTINSNFTRPTKPFFKNNSQNVSQIGYSLKCWSFHKASSVLARIIIYSSSLWISATSSFLFLFFFREALGLHSAWLCL